MDLIYLADAINAANDAADDWDGGPDKAREEMIRNYISAIPSVPAVPLDMLCELLAKNADCPPEHSPVQDHCIQTKCAECWKSVLNE